MKTKLIFMLTCSILINGVTYAAPFHPISEQSSAANASRAADGDKSRADQEASAEQPAHLRPAGNKRSGGIVGTGKRIAQVPRREARPTSSEINTRLAAVRESARAAKEGFAHNEILKSALPTRPPGAVPGRGSPANNLHHRDPNPAAIDGATNANSRNAGTINGTHMARRP